MTKITSPIQIINGDTVIGYTNSATIKDLGWIDTASLSSVYNDDPVKHHLGMIDLFTNFADYRMPTYRNFFANKEILEVNGADGRFTYELPVVKPQGVFTMIDTSDYSDMIGIDGSPFPIGLGQPFVAGDVLTYDATHGEQIVVSEDFPVEQQGDVWLHYVKMVSMDGFANFPADKLQKGIQYFKIGHVLGEYSTQYSNISTPNNVGTMTCEFVLGNHRGVETFYTQYADMRNMNGAFLRAADFWDKFAMAQDSIGVDSKGRPYDMIFTADLVKGKMNVNTLRVGAVLEYLVLFELMKIESTQLIFQKGGFVADINGTKRLNEGAIHQWRRGRIIEYSRELNKSHIKQAAAYVFRGRRDLEPHQRRLRFDCGILAYRRVLELFREEVLAQLDGLSPLLGTDRVLPSSPISGNSLTSLRMDAVMFTQVNIPEIGLVEINHEPALDYEPFVDRHSEGFYGDGYGHSAYTMVIRDASSPEYSNARTNLPRGTKLVDGGNKTANSYYVKPAGTSMWWGYENGRYAPDKASEIMSCMKRMGREFWAQSMSAWWEKDISKVVMIEKKR